MPSSRDLPNAGTEHCSPVLQVDSLLTEPQGTSSPTLLQMPKHYSFSFLFFGLSSTPLCIVVKLWLTLLPLHGL